MQIAEKETEERELPGHPTIGEGRRTQNPVRAGGIPLRRAGRSVQPLDVHQAVEGAGTESVGGQELEEAGGGAEEKQEKGPNGTEDQGPPAAVRRRDQVVDKAKRA